MIVGRDHLGWIFGASAAALAGCAAYLGFSGSSAASLTFGFLGTAVILFECLLSLRKKYPASPLGRVSAWLRAHIWLGLLSFVLILFHSGLSWGHGLAALLMWMFAIITLSGLLGLAFQNYLPRLMMEQVTRETLFDQIPVVIGDLRRESDERVEFVTADLGLPEEEVEYARAGGVKRYFDPAQRASAKEKVDAVIARRKKQAQIAIDEQSAAALRAHYLDQVRPFLSLDPPEISRRLFRSREAVGVYFDSLRAIAPPPAHPVLNDLENICEERRQLAIQQRLHHWLHGWLFVHVPLSMAFLVLILVHAVLSLRY